MKITTYKQIPTKKKAACRLVFVNSKGDVLAGPKKMADDLTPFVENGEFGKSFGTPFYIPSTGTRTLYMNMGEKKATAIQFRRATGKAVKLLKPKNIKTLYIDCQGLDEASVRAIVEGVTLGSYDYLDYKSDKDKAPKSLEEMSLNLKNTGVTIKKVQAWSSISDGVNLARDLMLQPPNDLYPETLAKKAKQLEKEGCFKAQILKQPEIEKENMNALLSVSQGSEKAPRFIIMDYNPKGAKKTFVLVGKAVTFDSGGLSLKPSSAMPEMKGDMGGGATVFGIMASLEKIQCPHRVVGLVPSVENMPSGTATRPSDVVISRAGISIEINNTDAEGRLILADALDYAKNFKPDYVIDYATLTGACLVALGPKICGIMGNHQKLVDAMVKVGYSLDDPFWQLPLEEDYEALLKSDVADVSNIANTRWGGTITAGLFLQRFAKDYKWAHCDIAASILEKPDDFNPKGGSGAGVRTTIEVFDKMS